MTEKIKKFVPYRNVVFLIMCLMVHIAYMVAFFMLDFKGLAILNGISSLIYVIFLLTSCKNKESEGLIVAAYFEIIGFCFLSELFTEGDYGFIFFIVGMISVLFYLTPSYKNRRFVFQGVGVIAAVFVTVTNHVLVEGLPFVVRYSAEYSNFVYFINLVIALFTVLYTCLFYEMQIVMMKRELEYKSSHDVLTDLYNRRYITDTISDAEDTDVVVVILDIDDFKKVNDIYGHATGDEVLKGLSKCLKDSAAANDGVAVRWGGEEFVVMYNLPAEAKIQNILKNLRDSIRGLSVLPDKKMITVTMGVASGRLATFEQLVNTADDRLYMGKENGKDCIVCEDIYR